MTQVPASSHGGGLPTGWTTDSGGALLLAPTTDDDPPIRVEQPTGAFSDLLELLNHGRTHSYVSADYQGEVTISPIGASTTPLSLVNAALSTSAILQLSDHTGALVCSVPDSGIVTAKGGALNPITSGALPTAAFVSATARQLSTTRDVFLTVPFTGDATNNAATCKVEVSPDNSTFSTLNTVSIAAALNLTGALDISIEAWVPAAWYVKLTAVHGSLGTGTYY